MQAHTASDSPRRGRRGRGAYLPDRLGSSLPASAQIGLRRRTPLTPGTVLHPKSAAKQRYKRRVIPRRAGLLCGSKHDKRHIFINARERKAAEFLKCEALRLYLIFPMLSEGIESSVREEKCRCLARGGGARQRPELLGRLGLGVKQSLELGKSGGGGRSALRPGGNSRAWRVDRPPALFSYAEENPRPNEPAYSSSTAEGTGSGEPDRKLNSRRVL